MLYMRYIEVPAIISTSTVLCTLHFALVKYFIVRFSGTKLQDLRLHKTLMAAWPLLRASGVLIHADLMCL